MLNNSQIKELREYKRNGFNRIQKMDVFPRDSEQGIHEFYLSSSDIEMISKSDDLLDGLKPTHKLLSVGADPKTVKGEKEKVRTGVMYLAPASSSGVMNVCAKASAGCIAACLNTAGRANPKMDKKRTIQAARIRRTKFFKRERPLFFVTLVLEIQNLINAALRANMTPALRPNGTADLRFDKIKIKNTGTFLDGQTIMEVFPTLTVYDYTKYPYSERPTESLPNNYHLTYSYSENSTMQDVKDNIENGRNVAVVFNNCVNEYRKSCHSKCVCSMPQTWQGIKVVDGDISDLRFKDQQGVIVGLRAKGKAREVEAMERGFVVRATA
jgi:hypothetical protein